MNSNSDFLLLIWWLVYDPGLTFVVDWALNNRSIFKERTCDEPVSFPTDEHHAARFTAFSPDNRQTTRPSRGSICCPTHSPATEPVDRVIKFHALCVCVSLSFFSLILSPAYPPTTTTTTTTRKKEKKKKWKKEGKRKRKEREKEQKVSFVKETYDELSGQEPSVPSRIQRWKLIALCSKSHCCLSTLDS